MISFLNNFADRFSGSLLSFLSFLPFFLLHIFFFIGNTITICNTEEWYSTNRYVRSVSSIAFVTPVGSEYCGSNSWLSRFRHEFHRSTSLAPRHDCGAVRCGAFYSAAVVTHLHRASDYDNILRSCFCELKTRWFIQESQILRLRIDRDI